MPSVVVIDVIINVLERFYFCSKYATLGKCYYSVTGM